jgi:hypothetical protein
VFGFDPESSIYRAIDAAYVAIQDLYISSHREAVGNDAGRGIEDSPLSSSGPPAA